MTGRTDQSTSEEELQLFSFRSEQHDQPARDVLAAWHDELDLGRGDRAQLRRADDLETVMEIPAADRLKSRLDRSRLRIPKFRRSAFAAMVAIVACVTEHQAHAAGFGDQIAQPARPGSIIPKLSEPLFRRLIAIETHEELLGPMRQVIGLLDGRADLFELADVTYRWNERSTRARMAEGYYGSELVLKPKA